MSNSPSINTARTQAQALLDALRDACAGNQQVAAAVQQSGRTAPALDVSRITLARRIKTTRQLIRRPDGLLARR